VPAEEIEHIAVVQEIALRKNWKTYDYTMNVFGLTIVIERWRLKINVINKI